MSLEVVCTTRNISIQNKKNCEGSWNEKTMQPHVIQIKTHTTQKLSLNHSPLKNVSYETKARLVGFFNGKNHHSVTFTIILILLMGCLTTLQEELIYLLWNFE